MDFTICYLEVFDEETNLWEYVAKSDEPESINSWFNNLESFFDEFNLSYLFKAIENDEQVMLLDKYKGLPIDCSETIRNSYYFYFEEVPMCHSASYFYLYELFNFDYNKSMNLGVIAKKDLKLWYPEIYKSKQEKISFNKWLGLDYFEELQLIRNRFYKYPKCRIIFFLYDIDID